MITLTAQIELLKSGTGNGENGTISGVSTDTDNLSKVNTSAVISDILGYKVRIAKPFVLGKSKLGAGNYFTSNLGYFESRQLSNDDGEFTTPFEITVNGTNINAVTLAFDDLNGAYPKSIVADGNIITDDDPFWTIGLETANTHTITISDWNKPNSPLIISGIYIDLTIDIDRKNIQSLESSIFDRADISLPSYGIISNTGKIDFIDIDGEVRDYVEQQILKSGLNVTITLNNTLTKAHETVAVLKTADWDNGSYNRTLIVSLKDDLEEWQEINVEAINYDPRYPQHRTAEWFYRYLYDKTPTKFNMLSFESLDGATQAVLSGTTIKYPFLKSSNLWNEWDKLCQLCQLHIYKDKGNTICKYNEGN